MMCCIYTYIIAASSMPLFLGWASDDPITKNWNVPKWKTDYQQSSPGRTFVTHNIPSGGHVVNAEYAGAILGFLRAS
jgi:hypothetical protein